MVLKLHHRIWISRTFAVLASALLVLSVVLVMAEPYDMPMLQVLAATDPDWPAMVQDSVLAWFGHSVWVNVALPLLVRPVWLVPACLMLVFAGSAISLMPQETPPNHKRS